MHSTLRNEDERHVVVYQGNAGVGHVVTMLMRPPG